MEETHLRAHRSYINTTQEILKKYCWPTIRKDSKQFNNHYPAYLDVMKGTQLMSLSENQIYQHNQENKYMRIFTLTITIDKFSKYIVAQEIITKAKIEDKMEEIIISNFPECKRLMTDNEPSFVTPAFKQMCIKMAYKR